MPRTGVFRVYARCKHISGSLGNDRADRVLLQGEWLATGIDSGSKFTAIDLTEGEWFDYDEKAGEEVSIKDIKWEVRRS